MKKILITGASGFVGSFLVDEALRLGYDVVAGVRAGSSVEFLSDPHIRFLNLAYNFPDTLAAQLQGESFNYIIHNAGITGTKGQGNFQEVNVGYTQRLVQAVKDAGLRLDKFMYISTLAVQGPGNKTMKPLRYGDPERPLSAYAKSKLQAEQCVTGVNCPFVILRPTAVYGPRDRDFLSLFRWVNRGVIPSIGMHQQMLSMIFVRDFAHAALAVLAIPNFKTHYLVSDGKGYDQEEIGQLIAGLLNKRTMHLRIPLALMRPALRLSDAVHRLTGRHPFLSLDKVNEISASNWLCDSRDLWSDIGRQPSVSLEKGLSETLDWYQSRGML